MRVCYKSSPKQDVLLPPTQLWPKKKAQLRLPCGSALCCCSVSECSRTATTSFVTSPSRGNGPKKVDSPFIYCDTAQMPRKCASLPEKITPKRGKVCGSSDY
ncbi:hypothetical protein TRVL_09102 [Trypanosoma vivax]|nr:hypothetical protein TRVL_09102 [Trypanosoma vivax]